MATRNYHIQFEFTRKLEQNGFEIWLPLPLKSEYQQVVISGLKTNANIHGIYKDKEFGAEYFYGKWNSDQPCSELSIQVQLKIHERNIDFAKNRANFHLSKEERDLYLRPRPHVPTDGIVEKTALEITSGVVSDLEKGRALYEWLVAHSERDPNQVGCGLGNVKDSLENKHICGRCVDISSVAVALYRAAGLPAREVFGVRVGPSKYAAKLGKTGLVSEAQHCRIEFFTKDYGWIPSDPGDVAKVALDESLDLGSARFEEIKNQLFGFWEPNWMAFNSARDFQLNPPSGYLENYLMYPLGLELGERHNPYDPVSFGYQIKSSEL